MSFWGKRIPKRTIVVNASKHFSSLYVVWTHVIKKCLCGMFSFNIRTMHVSKDDAYDANNNVIRSIYQVLIIGDFNLQWRVNTKRFRIVAKNLRKNSQNMF
jgi:hypothetical protein